MQPKSNILFQEEETPALKQTNTPPRWANLGSPTPDSPRSPCCQTSKCVRNKNKPSCLISAAPCFSFLIPHFSAPYVSPLFCCQLAVLRQSCFTGLVPLHSHNHLMANNAVGNIAQGGFWRVVWATVCLLIRGRRPFKST